LPLQPINKDSFVPLKSHFYKTINSKDIWIDRLDLKNTPYIDVDNENQDLDYIWNIHINNLVGHS
jgi:hypothetical protein